jgi:thiamine transporter
MNEPTKPTILMKNHETILATASGGMAIALSTVLSLIKLYQMPQGGSITPASLLPIFFCALAFGPAWGIGIGAVYGLLQFIISPYAAHWASIILDYPLAFALIGLAGLFSTKYNVRTAERNVLRRLGQIPVLRVIVAIVIGVAGRFAASFVSGMIFYGIYAPEGQSAAIYSLIYNATYILPDMVIIFIVLIPLAAVFRIGRRNNKKHN